MGNCLVTKSVDNVKQTPRKENTKNLDLEEAPKQLVVDMSKRRGKDYDDDKDDTSQGPNTPKKGEIKRNERNKMGKIMKGAEKIDPDSLYENINKISREKTQSDVTFIVNCLRNHFVFYNLSEHELEDIVGRMFYCEVPADDFIFKQGDKASSFFILESGFLSVIVNDKLVRELKSGDGFGELALLYSAPRSASIKSTGHCRLWGIDRHTFRKAVEEMITKQYQDNRIFIEDVKFFNAMTSDQKDAAASVLISQKFTKGQTIVNEGDPASSFYIIKEGTVQILKGGKELRKMGGGDSFGEQALYYNTVRGATVKALDNVKCLALGRDTLTKVLGDQVQVITFKNIQKWAIDKDEVLNKLTKIQIEKIIDNMKISNYKASDVIFTKGSACAQKIVIVIEGSLKKTKNDQVVARKNEVYGSEFIKGGKKDQVFDDNIIMETEGVLAELDYKLFFECIGGSFEEIMKKNERSHEKKMMTQVSELKKLGKNVQLEQLIFYKKLGYGQFGSVYLVKHHSSPEFFALKCVSKQQVVEQSLEKHLQQEKNVLEVVNFPFIMEFIRTFKDNNYLYFLVEYVKGMELFDVIREIGLLGTYDSQFYIGSMILAIEYLHAQSIIYRDLKPENIMIDDKGYMKLIDMGTAKFLKSKQGGGNRTFTIIGTPHYMAPEIITGKGYTPAVDLWSIGVCLYEFMCGMVPFGEEAEDPYEIYEEIITKPIKYPSYLKDKRAKRIMDQLINKVAEVRLGGSFASLKANPWFENFDWDKLLDKELKAPYTPPKSKLISDLDVKKMEALGKKAITELEEDQKKQGKKYKKEMASDPNWDRNF